MKKIDQIILTQNQTISRNIDLLYLERGVLSQNILAQLRNLVESVSLKTLLGEEDGDNSYENLQKGNQHVKKKAKLNFLARFHKLLQISTSHYTLDEENSERLMLKYYEFLLRMKKLLHEEYDITILTNLDKFPIIIDAEINEYYRKISNKIEVQNHSKINSDNARFYIQKKKPFFIDDEIYYEITFNDARDKASKTDRIIAFTKQDIMTNYSLKLVIEQDSITIKGREMPIQIITNWEVSVRPCEFNKLADILGYNIKIQGNHIEYKNLMSYLKVSQNNILDLLNFIDEDYDLIKSTIIKDSKKVNLFMVLDQCRKIIKLNMSGSNILKYLIYSLNNNILKNQYYWQPCSYLSNLYLKFGCIPFEQMPFVSSLVGHNPKIDNLLNCIAVDNREHEFLARKIKNNTEQKSQLYTSSEELDVYGDVNSLINKYNSKIYHKHINNRTIKQFKKYYYISGYENDTIEIIQKLKELSSTGINNYRNSVNSWLTNTEYEIDCSQKKEVIKEIFVDTRVALIYGSAGTGKSTLINHISNFHDKNSKLFLANTNPAIDNLKRKINAPNSTFKTISSYNYSNSEKEYDLLIIDECSTVSNSDMIKILDNTKFKLLVLVGDIFQIESIIFGNWFSFGKKILNKKSIFELTVPYRSSDEKLLNLWEKVRNLEEDLLEHITTNNYSLSLDDSVFEVDKKDEIILCLNYDGLYGINNINKFLQNSNSNPPIEWGLAIYKVGDPILFNDSNRFSPVIFNNLKGRITNIHKNDDEIMFDIAIDKVINEMDVEDIDLDFIYGNQNISVIRFKVKKYKDTDDEDDRDDAIVPFQIAYAVSIHKAQGLEYKSVKIVITNEVDELIDHNILYTAITRAKSNLKIYWTPDTENKILSNLKINNNHRDMGLISNKLINKT